jgi:excisionase family DNA binding protein
MRRLPLNEPPIAISCEQAARLLQLRPQRIREEVRAGRLRARRVGRLWRIRRVDLDAYLAQSTTPAAAV